MPLSQLAPPLAYHSSASDCCPAIVTCYFSSHSTHSTYPSDPIVWLRTFSRPLLPSPLDTALESHLLLYILSTHTHTLSPLRTPLFFVRPFFIRYLSLRDLDKITILPSQPQRAVKREYRRRRLYCDCGRKYVLAFRACLFFRPLLPRNAPYFSGTIMLTLICFLGLGEYSVCLPSVCHFSGSLQPILYADSASWV